MVRAVSVLLLACSAPAKPALENHGHDRPVACDGLLHGTMVGRGTRQVLAGVTLVLSGPGEAESVISDQSGRFALAVSPGRYVLTSYYGAYTQETVVVIQGGVCPPELVIAMRSMP
jgi:hypothetical protein